MLIDNRIKCNSRGESCIVTCGSLVKQTIDESLSIEGVRITAGNKGIVDLNTTYQFKPETLNSHGNS